MEVIQLKDVVNGLFPKKIKRPNEELEEDPLIEDQINIKPVERTDLISINQLLKIFDEEEKI